MIIFLFVLSHFQEDSNVLKYVLFKHYMNKLQIFEILIIAYQKHDLAWSTVQKSKTMILHDL